MNSSAIAALGFLRILGHELRWQLIRTLARSDYRVQELAAQLQQPQNLVSYHLKQLRTAKLLSEHRSTADGRDVYYSLDVPQLQRAYEGLGVALHPMLSMQAANAQANIPSGQPRRVLFLCTENSARSQMAEGLLRHLGGDRLQVFSAGTAPTRIHPNAIRVMAEKGIDIQAQRSKSVDEFQDRQFDYVITVCDRARENCPTFPGGTTFVHWSLPDPAVVADEAAQRDAFERTAQALTERIQSFLLMLAQV